MGMLKSKESDQVACARNILQRRTAKLLHILLLEDSEGYTAADKAQITHNL